MITVCPRCGREFEQRTGPGQHRKYCRPDCDYSERDCPQCHTPFRGPPHQVCCSTECRLKAMSERNRTDHEAQAYAGRFGGLARTAQLPPAKATSYLKGSRTDTHVHRIVAAAVLGRDLLPGEVVHHEDRNKHNNAPHNLIVFVSQAEHAKHHSLEHQNVPCDCQGIRLKEVMPK